MNIYDSIRKWASDRNIINGATPVSQAAKLASEIGELAGHIDETADEQEALNLLMAKLSGLYPDYEINAANERLDALELLMIDDIGDSLVVLTIIGVQLGVNIEDCTPDACPADNAFLKSVAAVGKLSDAVLKNDLESFKEIVSVLFTLFGVMASDLGVTVVECIENAYDEIKDRKGIMYNGTFIKESDERFRQVMSELEAKKINFS